MKCGVGVKVYFLRFTSADFVLEGGRWVSSAVDLYENTSYTNYSVTKSQYGSIGAPLKTWLGAKRTPSAADWTNFTFFTREEIVDDTWLGTEFNTDSGMVRSDRYIDTSGRIDIVSYNVNAPSSSMELTVYSSDTADDTYFLNEWERSESYKTSEEINYVDANRYAKFVVDTIDNTFPTDVKIYVRIEIDQPVMAPMYRQTYKLLNKFPEWMDLHEEIPATGTTSVEKPTNIGGGFLNAIAGEWLDDLTREVSYRDFQRYISTVDVDQMAWAYKTSISDEFIDDMLPVIILSVTGDGTRLAHTANWEEFLQAANDDACYVDYEERTVYTAKAYTTLLVNGTAYSQSPHHVRNYIDEIGTFVDLDRLYLENNQNYILRIRDVYQNRGGVGVESLKLALRRELDIWRVHGATPDSAYLGATPEILSMDDIEKDPKYFSDDGMPTKDFVELVEDLSWKYPTTWGRFRWGEALWDASGGEDHPGYGITPYRYDQDQVATPHIQSGVGDGNDLFVFRPDIITGPRDVTTTLKARGRHRSTRTEYPGVDVSFAIKGKGTRDYYDNPVKSIYFTAEITTNDATPVMYLASFIIEAQSDVDAGQATPSEESYTFFDLFAEDAPATSVDLNFVHPDTNAPYADTGIIPVDKISTVALKQGRWVAGVYENIETMDHYEAWFSHDETKVLTQPTGGSISYGYTADATPYLPQPEVVLKSLAVDTPTAQTWYSDEYEYDVTINGVSPYLSPGPNVTIDVPEILWDPAVTSRTLEVSLKITNANGDFGGVTKDNDDDEVFIPASIILLDGDGTWSSGAKSLATTTTSFDLSIGTLANTYPIVFDVWTLFENDQLAPYPGVVDENGPWRNGEPQDPGGSKNYAMVTYDNLNRTHFNIPDNADYVVTWIGVEDDNGRVLTWIDTNTVVPIDAQDVSYPDNAIQETLLNGAYYFDPITVYARLRPIDPEWYPQIHSGYFYDNIDEYYLYANKKTETVTAGELILEEVARQGAPIIARTVSATPVTLRQIAFFDETATPISLSLTQSEEMYGSGTVNLYAAYSDIYDVVVKDSSGNTIGTVASVASNKIVLGSATDVDELYTITYKVNNSFYADHTYVDPTTGLQRTKIVFDAADSYSVTYETSDYDPATPINVPLNPLYTTQGEGFLYISFNEYTLDSIQVRVSPGKILADSVDYIVVTIRSLDSHGNPKPKQNFTLSTTFGTLDNTTVTTDRDGFAVVTLRSTAMPATPIYTGTITISGGVNASVDFEIEEPNTPTAKLFAVPSVEQIIADGVSQILVYGKIEDVNFQPVSGATVSWKRARSIYELFGPGPIQGSGNVTTNADGVFTIGPFTSLTSEDSGYWFVAAEATVGGNLIGDIVFWYEYPDAHRGVEGIDGLPRLATQLATPIGTFPNMADTSAYPVTYDEEGSATPNTVTINWEPPSWYAIDGYTQYQMGLTGHENEKHI